MSKAPKYDFTPSTSKAKITHQEPLDNSKSRFIKLEKLKYEAPDGKVRDWEMASRSTRPAGGSLDGVGILAITKQEPRQIILQKQFRPPVNGICIEMPAGLIDPNETVAQCALRELSEETGLVGEVLHESIPVYNDPGFCNTNTVIVVVEIDLTRKENVNPVTHLEENEFIETFHVPLATFTEELDKLFKEGYHIDARVHNVAEGLRLSKALKI
ncbi:unnamed protein product [Ambrosiozyma monospora]|uniref:Unnamed protein product n=1 Tax=Ambrosiozyma monospora TaxID=43982 RepID=A0A9W6YZ20_AMBMO|nr:unnamed protein product [Ambrosiozyma monospora]